MKKLFGLFSIIAVVALLLSTYEIAKSSAKSSNVIEADSTLAATEFAELRLLEDFDEMPVYCAQTGYVEQGCTPVDQKGCLNQCE